MDDRELFQKSAQGRDVNRHNYTVAELEEALKQPVTRAIIALARLRKHNAFNGEFTYAQTGHNSMTLAWVNGEESVRLHFITAVDAPSFVIEVASGTEVETFNSVESFATYREN
jgi:sucrose phosphorylase